MPKLQEEWIEEASGLFLMDVLKVHRVFLPRLNILLMVDVSCMFDNNIRMS